MFDLSIKIDGLDKLQARLADLQQKAQAMAGEHTLPIPPGMTQEQAIDAWIKSQLE